MSESVNADLEEIERLMAKGAKTYYITDVGDLYCCSCRKITFSKEFVDELVCRWCKVYHQYLDPDNQQDLWNEDGYAVLHRASTASTS